MGYHFSDNGNCHYVVAAAAADDDDDNDDDDGDDDNILRLTKSMEPLTNSMEPYNRQPKPTVDVANILTCLTLLKRDRKALVKRQRREEEEKQGREFEECSSMTKETTRRWRIIDAVKRSSGYCTLQPEKALTKQEWFNDLYEAFQAKYKNAKGRTILWKDVQKLYERTNILKRRVQTKTEKILKKNQITDTRDPVIKKRFDTIPMIDPVACFYSPKFLTPLGIDSATVIATGLRRMEEKFFECEQIAADHGPEGIKHLLKIITEKFEFLTRKQCDETTAENRNNKRKREPNSNIERNMKRLCTDSLNQKRNETVTSSNHVDPNPIQRVPDILNQTDDFNDTKEQTTGADFDPVVNDVSSMRSGDKLMVTSESIDIDALLKEIQKEYDSSTMTSNECFSDEKQTIEVTTSAQADNPPSTSHTNGGPGTKQACSSSKQGTNCDQNIPSNSDENNRISTDDLGNLFPDLDDILKKIDFLDEDDIFGDFQKF